MQECRLVLQRCLVKKRRSAVLHLNSEAARVLARVAKSYRLEPIFVGSLCREKVSTIDYLGGAKISATESIFFFSTLPHCWCFMAHRNHADINVSVNSQQ